MTGRQRDRTDRRDRGPKLSRGVSPDIYLPAAEPPQKQPRLLAAAAMLLAAWLLFLLYLAVWA